MVISFSAGHPLNTPLCANITIIDDDTLENTEAFSVSLYTDYPEGVFLSRDRNTVEIIDNEEGISSRSLSWCMHAWKSYLLQIVLGQDVR